jgi:sulfite dehydrogenase (cytochrome) subunit B
MSAPMWRIFAAAAFLVFGAGAQAEEDVARKAGAGRDVVENYCNACHSLDYPRINAPFLDRQSWETEVKKMIAAYGAPITPADAKIIVDYLTANYGSGR